MFHFVCHRPEDPDEDDLEPEYDISEDEDDDDAEEEEEGDHSVSENSMPYIVSLIK